MSNEHTGPNSPALGRRPLLLAAALGVLLRLSHLLVVSSTPILGYHHTFEQSDMYLFDQWAQRIANGDVLGREVYHPLGAWQLEAAPIDRWRAWYGEAPVFYKAPFYAYLIAALYRVFDDPMLPLAVLQILVAAASIVLLGRVTGRIFGSAAGICAALLYAVYGPDIHFDVAMLRGPWIIVISLIATWQLLELQRSPGAGRALGLGAIVGVALLVNEGFLTVTPLILLLLVAWFRGARRLAIIGGAFALGMAIALLPLVVRNLAVGSPALQVAVTGSTVYAVFNAAGSSPYFFHLRPGVFVPIIEASGGELVATILGCLRSFASAADVALFYLHKAVGLVIPFESPDNTNFYYAVHKSPLLGWLPGYGFLLPASVSGLALAARRFRAWAALLPFSVSLLASILLTVPLSRYRATLAVFLVPFAALALVEAVAFFRARRLLPMAAVVLGAGLVFLAAGVLQDRVVFAGVPRAAYYYRPAEFLLGASVYEREGRLTEAIAEAQSLLRLNPHRPTKVRALLVVGRLEALRGNLPQARDALSRARPLASAEPPLYLNLGDLYWRAIGDRGAAADCYRAGLLLGVPDTVRATIEERLRVLEQGEG